MELILLLTILAVCISIYYYFFNKMTYFERLKVPHLRPVPILGNMAPVIFGRLPLAETTREAYNSFPDVKYIGFYDYLKPIYIIRDPELINSITNKNFDYFCDHNNFINEKIDKIAGSNLFGLRGDNWRQMRKILSPSFTSSKMKMMFELMRECAKNYSSILAADSKNGKIFEMKDLMSRYANDIVATCAFGINIDSMNNPNNEFLLVGRKAISFDTRQYIIYIMNKHLPLLSKIFGIRMYSDKMENFFKRVVSDTVKLRKEKGIVRPDMIQLMLETMSDNEKWINIDEMTSQAFIFFLGGFDTVSTFMSFVIHVLGVNPDIQSKLQVEIDNIIRQTNGEPTYEDINGMKYLDAVVKETLRLYPLVAFIDRMCVRNFELPPATPDGESVLLKPGDTVWFPSYGLHLDPQHFPDPHRFDPNRFLENNVKDSIYMPFGIGPRKCIGDRFAMMESKLFLLYLLSRCDIVPSMKTKIPLVFRKRTFLMMAEGGFWMKLQARKMTDFGSDSK